MAAQNGHKDALQLLLDRGANPNLACRNGCTGNDRTALHIASQFGREDCVRLLLKAGAAVDVRGPKGATPLSIACEVGYTKIVEILLEAGAPANGCYMGGVTPLVLASQNGHEKIVRLLLDGGASVCTAAGASMTPLTQASRNGYHKIVQLLCERGADPNVKDAFGFTPMQIASACGHKEIARMLWEVKLGQIHTRTSAQPGPSSPGANTAAQQSSHSVHQGGSQGGPARSQAHSDAAAGPSGQRHAVKACLWCGTSGKQLKRCGGCLAKSPWSVQRSPEEGSRRAEQSEQATFLGEHMLQVVDSNACLFKYVHGGPQGHCVFRSACMRLQAPTFPADMSAWAFLNLIVAIFTLRILFARNRVGNEIPSSTGGRWNEGQERLLK